MTDKILAATVTGITNPIAINVSQSHDSAVSMANIQCITSTLTIGDHVNVNLGYSTGTSKVFSGYVKAIETKTPDGVITITAHDDMTRAVDYFIVSNDPVNGYQFQNITAQALIQTLMEMAGLYSFDLDNTHFTLGVNNAFSVNLVSSYDYSRMIADLIAWMVWCDRNGIITLKNRKPYPMTGTSGQPGDVADSPIATITDTGLFDASYGFNEKDLRNKVAIYGAEGLYKDASSPNSYDPGTGTTYAILPSGYYKAMVLASPLIDDATFAQNACNYNLAMYNKLTYEVPVSAEGNPILEARKVITVTSTKGGISGNWYIFSCEHSWGKGGYTCNMVLRK